MAHPCFSCGSECYCNGDIDDCILSKTPLNCKGCGCEDDFNEDTEVYDSEEEDDDIYYP